MTDREKLAMLAQLRFFRHEITRIGYQLDQALIDAIDLQAAITRTLQELNKELPK